MVHVTGWRIGRSVLGLGLVVASWGVVGCGSGSGGGAPVSEAALGRSVIAMRSETRIPAVFAAVISSEGVAVAAEGVRKQGEASPVGLGDRVHLGSNTKSFTSTLAAILIEEGKLSWGSKLKTVFPEWTDGMRKEFVDVTIADLLGMRGSVKAIFDAVALGAVPVFQGSSKEQRLAFTRWVLAEPLDAPVGEYNYSNGGYIVAAAMIERVTGKDWDSLVAERILKPLGITTLTYGWPARSAANQPWGHLTDESGAFVPFDPNDPSGQIPKYLAPAGDLSMSLRDYARWVQMNLRGLRGQQTLVRPETMTRLHTPSPGGFFALGWAREDRGGVPTSLFIGSLEPFTADVWIQPSVNRAVVVVISAGTNFVDTMERLIGELIGSRAATGLIAKEAFVSRRLR